jgi:glutathione S-transferase
MTLRLITIPTSHFCEKARWALDHAGLSFREEGHLPMFHFPANLRVRAGLTVPVLVHDGGVLSDSPDILRWADDHRAAHMATIYPAAQRAEIEELERTFGDSLGPSVRLWAYAQLLPHIELVEESVAFAVPLWEQRMLARMRPLAKRILGYRVGVNAESAAAARRDVLRVFDEVARELDGRRYLVGGVFSAADLTFAALAAPTVLPAAYARFLPPLSALPASLRLQVEAFREHPAGRYALALYDAHRSQS